MQFFGIAPEKGASQKEVSSSKNFFSEAMLFFWGVFIQYKWCTWTCGDIKVLTSQLQVVLSIWKI